MNVETVSGIIDVDLSKVSLSDVNKIISKISVDADLSNTAPTVLYGVILTLKCKTNGAESLSKWLF